MSGWLFTSFMSTLDCLLFVPFFAVLVCKLLLQLYLGEFEWKEWLDCILKSKTCASNFTNQQTTKTFQLKFLSRVYTHNPKNFQKFNDNNSTVIMITPRSTPIYKSKLFYLHLHITQTKHCFYTFLSPREQA